MPNPATAIFRQITYKAESSYGVIPSMVNAKAIRRVEFSPELTKDTYQSNEIRTDQQIADMRHGMRRAGGTLRGELSVKAYEDFFAALLRKDFASVADTTGISATLAVDGAAPAYTITRASGDFLSDNKIKVGDVVRITAGTWTDALNTNLLVTNVTTTVLSVICINGKSLTAQSNVTGTAISVVGKKTMVPSSNHTDKSFSIESFFSDLAKSEIYSGMKVTQASLALPSSGIATVDFVFSGRDVTTYATQQSSSIVTTHNAYGVAAAVNGVLVIGGARQLVVRDLSININGNFGSSSVAGSNTAPFQFAGPLRVDGQFVAYFDSTTMRDAFLNETELSLSGVFTLDNSDNANFIAISLPRIKLGSATKNDAADGIVQTISFTALRKTDGGSGSKYDDTTIALQDSQAT